MNEIRRADPLARRRAFVALILVAALGLLLALTLPALQARLEEWLMAGGGAPADRLQVAIRAIGVAMGLLLLWPAFYCYRVAARVDAAAEFPPPGMKLVRDARVLRGDAARGRAWILRALAIKLTLMALVVAVVLWVFAGTLLP